MEQSLKCLIAAGGTFGHVAPSLAVAEALRRRGVQVTFAGSPDRVEARLVPEAGYQFDAFRVAGLPRRPGAALGRALALAATAPVACMRILARRRPDVVLGGGGFVAGPMVAAAAARRVPTALMEADAHLGLANRLTAPLAQRVFLSFPIAGRDGAKYRVTGRPIPGRSRAVPRADARRVFRMPEDEDVLLVFGGSQGARALNEAMISAFAASGPAVLHLSGERDYDSLRDRVLRDDYRLVAFTDDFGAALAAADLAVARAGGSTWELAAAGVPAILVPYPHATGDHQRENAAYFAERGGAILVPQAELAGVPDLVRDLLTDTSRREAMARAMRDVARPDAADEIAEELVDLARGRSG